MNNADAQAASTVAAAPIHTGPCPVTPIPTVSVEEQSATAKHVTSAQRFWNIGVIQRANRASTTRTIESARSCVGPFRPVTTPSLVSSVIQERKKPRPVSDAGKLESKASPCRQLFAGRLMFMAE